MQAMLANLQPAANHSRRGDEYNFLHATRSRPRPGTAETTDATAVRIWLAMHNNNNDNAKKVRHLAVCERRRQPV